MRFTLEIELGNDAMQTIGQAMNAALLSVNRFGAAGWGTTAIAKDGDGAAIRDENGNKVGQWLVVEVVK